MTVYPFVHKKFDRSHVEGLTDSSSMFVQQKGRFTVDQLMDVRNNGLHFADFALSNTLRVITFADIPEEMCVDAQRGTIWKWEPTRTVLHKICVIFAYAFLPIGCVLSLIMDFS